VVSPGEAEAFADENWADENWKSLRNRYLA